MRVKKTRTSRYDLPLRRPLRSAAGNIDRRRGVLVTLFDEDDRAGIGDAAPLPGFSRESLADVENALESALGRSSPLFDASLGSLEDLAKLIDALTLPAAASHAIDMALLDLLAQRRGLPLNRLLGTTCRDAIPVHALVQDAEDAKVALQQGFSRFKAKVGADFLDEDDQRVREIRQAIGRQSELRLDANGAWADRTTALSALERLARHRICYIEQPVPANAIDLLVEVRAYSPIPVAADESVRSAADLALIIERKAADAVVLKPMLCGGLRVALEMSRRAAEAGLPVSITTTFESCVGRLAAAHLAATVPGKLLSCGLGANGILADDVASCPPPQHGLVQLPQQPGLGIALNDTSLGSAGDDAVAPPAEGSAAER